MIKIYTKTGDKGTTGLANGERVLKNSDRIEAYGTVDELNSLIGICLEYMRKFPRESELNLEEWCLAIQNDLFNIGSDLATPIESRWDSMKIISNNEITKLEQMIDKAQCKLPPLREFILPGGSLLNSYLHLTRTICRRAERMVVQLSQGTEINLFTIQYLNRLSDLFFVLARYVSERENSNEIKWNKDGGVELLSV